MRGGVEGEGEGRAGQVVGCAESVVETFAGHVVRRLGGILGGWVVSRTQYASLVSAMV